MRVKLLCASLLAVRPGPGPGSHQLPRGSASDVSRPDDLFALPPGEWQYAKHLWEGREPCLQEQCEAGFTAGDMVVSVEHSGKNVRIIAGLRNCTATAFSEMETGRKPGKSTRNGSRSRSRRWPRVSPRAAARPCRRWRRSTPPCCSPEARPRAAQTPPLMHAETLKLILEASMMLIVFGIGLEVQPRRTLTSIRRHPPLVRRCRSRSMSWCRSPRPALPSFPLPHADTGRERADGGLAAVSRMLSKMLKAAARTTAT